ncbi:unnamed protein product [Angiostrongylus costaricensis]|uniref:receptor protein-tyrosine kinase n=1 Tax=Angiostrongylus costaricensis TaxID=334426 RepID=A0A158PIK2_ANGCS|nr:unnamed protein product [Angiostrongylus costaricensis]
MESCGLIALFQRVLQVVLEGIGIAAVAHAHFALRLISGPIRHAADHVWLHPYLLISNLRHTYARFLTLELRLRFVPQSAYELLLTESNAFFYLNEQVCCDFLSHVAWKVNLEAALELAALKVCRDFIEKKTYYIYREFKILTCLLKFFPNVPICAYKRRVVIEISKCPFPSLCRFLKVGWGSPVDLLVGPEVGLSYRVNERCELSRLAELRSVLEIVIKKMEQGSEKAILQLKISGNAQLMLITVATYDIAESLAHLIDGYQMMYNQGESVFKRKGLERCGSADMRTAVIPRAYASVALSHDLRVRREHITLKELIGGGQFGNVYSGTLGSVPIPVAVKVCKLENEPMDTQLILQESHLMKNLQHENIISLIGVCMDAPMWLIMELAPLGELRQYLQSNRASLTINSLILYSLQIARALSYLHGKSFVHRDIAARNVLVSTPKCAKLTDFGLSRALDYDAIYTASRGKLPIKWLAPESINYREFSMASDIWMYGVCVWEIMSWGVKPWQGVANADVITRIEAGERLPCPDGCPPVLFNYLELMLWALQPQKRPTAKEIVAVFEVPITMTFNVPVLLTNIATLPNLTLWRTLEEQKRQAEENDRWLDELFQERLRNITPISQTVTAVIGAIDRLSNAFNTNMKHDDFVSSIKYLSFCMFECVVNLMVVWYCNKIALGDHFKASGDVF